MTSPVFATTRRDRTPSRYRRPIRLTLLLLFFVASSGCDSSSPTAPTAPSIRIEVPDPAIATVPSVDLACIEIPVTLFNLRSDADGRLDAIVLSALVRDTNRLVATNRRPNVDFPIPDTELPAGGTLIAPGGLCYPREISSTGLELQVRVEVSIFPPRGAPFLATAEARVSIVEQL